MASACGSGISSAVTSIGPILAAKILGHTSAVERFPTPEAIAFWRLPATIRATRPAVIVLQTCKGDLSIERWAEICQVQ